DGWRRDREDHRVAYGREVPRRAGRERLHRLRRLLARAPVLELHEHEAGVLAGAREVEADDGEHAVDDVALLGQEIILRGVERDPGALLRRAGRRLHLAVENAGVLVGYERRRQARIEQRDGGDYHGVDREHSRGPPQAERDAAVVAARARAERAVEPAEWATARVVLASQR